MSTPIGFGVPQRLRIEGAVRPDFSDAVRLVDYHKQTVYDTGPIIMRRFREIPCRYIRLIAVEPDIDIRGLHGPQIGFAEIEIFSQSRNVALGKAVHTDLKPLNPDRSLAALTDGCNLYGRILPVRTWMNELARRHDLETERPVVVAEMATEIPSLTVSEAVMRMDLSDQPALMFRNQAHGGLNMVYRRSDGNIGWIDPRGNRSE